MSKDGTDEILEKIIKNEPYSLSITDFENIELVNALLYTDILQQKNNKLGMSVPVFVEKDAGVLKELSKKAAKDIAGELIKQEKQIVKIIKKVDNGYSHNRNLYHLLCGYIFDGLMFDYLDENKLVTTSLVHNSGLDYLVILYEDSEKLNEYSDLLLCSYNRLMINGKGFVSFGDSNGNRKDLYRYMRLKELNQLSEQENRYMSFPAKKLIENFNKLIDNKEIDSEYIEIYEYFEYCKNGEVIVPVYNEDAYKVADELYEYVRTLVKRHIFNALAVMQEEKRLLCIAHKVAVKDIANEIYHLIFGEVNELLVLNGLVSMPPTIPGEGRYFKSFER